MLPLNIVFVEQDDDLHQPLEPHYRKLFEELNYSADFFWVTNEKDAKKAILNNDIHVFISDLTFDGSNIGFEIIRNIRIQFPDIFVIATSKADYSPRDLVDKKPSFHLFIDKTPFLDGSKDYIDALVKDIQSDLKINTEVVLQDEDRILGSHFKVKDKRQVQSILRQVLYSGFNSDDRMRPNKVRLVPLTGGKSGSKVFRMHSENHVSGFPSVPAVLKISDSQAAEREYQNFERLVRWGLPYMMRVDVLGTGFTKNFGGICYSFVLGGDRDFEMMTDLIQASSWSRVDKIVGKIFNPTARKWYSNELQKGENNLNRRYSSRYFPGKTHKRGCTTVFNETVNKMFGSAVGATNVTVNGKVYPTPVEALFGSPHGKYLSCICHGDLNSSNVIVAENDEIIFIDFQDAGRGHVFEDFVTLESSVRLNHDNGVGEDWNRLLELEEKIEFGEHLTGLPDAYKTIAKIRKLAVKNFPTESKFNYFYSIAAFHFRLLRVKDLNETQKNRCVSTILVSLSKMDELRGQ